MTILLVILISFICLVVVGVKYDTIVPSVSRMIKKPVVYVPVVCVISGWFLMKDWGTTMITRGTQSSYRWGYPISRSLLTLVTAFCTVGIIYILIRKITTSDDRPRELICISCLTVFNPDEVKTDVCPKCSGEIQKVAGVFDSNPDLFGGNNESSHNLRNGADRKS